MKGQTPSIQYQSIYPFHGQEAAMRILRSLFIAGILVPLLGESTFAQEADFERLAVDHSSPEVTTVRQDIEGQRPTPSSSTLLERPARLDVADVPLKDALTQLHRSAGIPLLFSPSLLPEVDVSCRCTEVTVGEALDRMINGQGLRVVAGEAQVMIVRPVPSPMPESASVPRVSLAVETVGPIMPVIEQPEPPTQQAVGTITGRVTDSRSGQPLASVQIYIEGMDIGTLTQQNGRYLLQGVPAGTHTVTAERIGYRTQTEEVTVGDAATVVQDFAVVEEALQLDQVIVTGTPGGTQRRAIGNSVGRVEAAEITSTAPVLEVQDLLGGREPGLSFHRQSGNIGTGSQIRIRGVSSVSMGAQPLIYVDGVRVDNEAMGGPNLRDGPQVATLDDFSPDEIESIEIIKGPAAATLYGTEASAGVIQIITKRGETGAPQFDVSVRQGAVWLPNISEKVGLSYGRDESGNVISFNIYEAERAAGREHFQTGRLQTYTASMRGGTESVRYFLSGDFNTNEGIVDYNWEDQTNLRANVSVVPSEEYTLDVSLGYVTGTTSFMQQRTAWGMWEQFQWANPEGRDRILRGFLRARPEEIADNEAIRDMNRFTASATVTHRPADWLTHKLIIGTDVLNEENSVLFPRRPEGADHDFGALSLGYLEIDRPVRRYNTLDYAASLNYGYGEDVTLTSSFGAQYYSRTEEQVSGTGRIFPAPQIRTLSGAAQTISEQTFVENKSVGVYVQQELGWRDRVFLTAAVRGDDNSAFGADFDAAVYPKFSGTWVISEEPFWDDWSDIVNALRLRAAWGKAGRQPETFAAVTLYRPEVGPGDSPAVSTDVLGNADVGPEVSSELEVGFDAAFLNDRISAEFTYYNQKVDDALIAVPVSPVSGFTGSQSVNLGQLSNWGWEVTVDSRLYERSNFAWDLGLGLSSTENKVEDLGGVAPTNDLREGRPYPFITGTQALTVELDPSTRNVTNVVCDGGTGFDGRSRGGAPTPCTQAPELQLGNGLAIPKYEATLNTTFTLFQNLRLYAMAEWRGEHWRSLTDAACRHVCFYTSRAAVERPDEYAFTVAAIDGLIPGSPYTSWFDASFAKLREVSANYTLSDDLAGRIGASRASINVAARNLWTIWQAEEDVAGAPVTDPEARNADSLTSSNSNIPPLASFAVTLRASF